MIAGLQTDDHTTDKSGQGPRSRIGASALGPRRTVTGWNREDSSCKEHMANRPPTVESSSENTIMLTGAGRHTPHGIGLDRLQFQLRVTEYSRRETELHRGIYSHARFQYELTGRRQFS